MKRFKKGQRVKWVSLDETVVERGVIVEVSPSADRAEVEWDDGEISTINIGASGRVFPMNTTIS